VIAYDCQGGSLALTLLPKATDLLEIDLNGHRVLGQRIGGLPSWHSEIAVPPSHETEVCDFKIRGGALLGSTVIQFDRPS
jgi:hypothetical protein